ncbi:alpha/beta hydrolase [Salinifilum ghardaiensis]
MIGELVHRFVPAGRGEALTLVLLHGTGGDEHSPVGCGARLDPGAALLCPRGPVGLGGGGFGWFRRDDAGAVLAGDLVSCGALLGAFLPAACVRCGVDAARLVLVGCGDAATAVAAVVLQQPQLVRAAVVFSPGVPFDAPPAVDLSAVSVFVAAERAGPGVPPRQAVRLVEQLRKRGAPVRTCWDGGAAEVVSWLAALRVALGVGSAP